MKNTIKQINKDTIQLTKDGTHIKRYYKVIPGVSEFTIKDLTSYIKYKGEYYA